MTTRQERLRQNSRDEILEAAKQLFGEVGIERATMRKIADRVGLSAAALYRYFSNQNEIYFHLRQQGFDLFFEKQQQAQQHANFEDRIQAQMRTYLDFAFENPELYELMFIMRAPMDEVREQGWAERTKRSYELARSTMIQCMDAGLLVRNDPDVVAMGIWSFLHGIVSLHIRDRFVMHGKPDKEKIIQTAMSFLFTNLVRPVETEN